MARVFCTRIRPYKTFLRSLRSTTSLFPRTESVVDSFFGAIVCAGAAQKESFYLGGTWPVLTRAMTLSAHSRLARMLRMPFSRVSIQKKFSRGELISR
jgi:hypothetical protein